MDKGLPQHLDLASTMGSWPDESDPIFRALADASADESPESIVRKMRRWARAADDSSFLVPPDQTGSSDHDDHLGRQCGAYTLLRRIGAGGSSVVYEAASHPESGERVAIKLLTGDSLQSIDRLNFEKRVLRRLDHPCLITLIDSGFTEDGRPYLVMPLIDGRHIDRFVAEEELDHAHIARLFARLARAMDSAHRQQILHRDLKPSNILIDRRGRPVITDFGLAKRFGSDKDSESLTASLALVGTIAYMAPEQVQDKGGQVSPATDIYGLGATLYCVLGGRPPVEGGPLIQMLTAVGSRDPARLRRLNPAIPRDLETICHTCLHKDPRDRYLSMRELAADLARFWAGRPVVARREPWHAMLRRWARANPLPAALSGALLVTLLVGLVVVFWLWRQSAESRERLSHHLDFARRIIRSEDETAESMLAGTAGAVAFRQQRLQKATTFLDELVELYPDDDELFHQSATGYYQLGQVANLSMRMEDAIAAYSEALRRYESLASRNPEDHSITFDIFHSMLALASVTAHQDPVRSIQLNDRALEIIQDLAERHPEDPFYLDAWACQAANCGRNALYAEEWSRAETLLETAWRISNELGQEFPDRPELCRHRATSALYWSAFKRLRGDFGAAIEWATRAVQFSEEHYRGLPDRPAYLEDVLQSKATLAQAYLSAEDRESATAVARDLVALTESAIDKYPDFQVFRYLLDTWRSELPTASESAQE